MTGTDICFLSNTSAFNINITQAIKSSRRQYLTLEKFLRRSQEVSSIRRGQEIGIKTKLLTTPSDQLLSRNVTHQNIRFKASLTSSSTNAIRSGIKIINNRTLMSIIKIKLFLNKVSTMLDFGFLDRRQSIHTLRAGFSISSLSIDQLTSFSRILNIIERLLMLVLLYPMFIECIIFGEHVLNLILELLKLIIEFLARTFQRKQFSLHFKFRSLFNGTITRHCSIIDIRNFLSKTRPICWDDRQQTRLCIFVTGNRRTRTGRIDIGTHISSMWKRTLSTWWMWE